MIIGNINMNIMEYYYHMIMDIPINMNWNGWLWMIIGQLYPFLDIGIFMD